MICKLQYIPVKQRYCTSVVQNEMLSCKLRLSYSVLVGSVITEIFYQCSGRKRADIGCPFEILDFVNQIPKLLSYGEVGTGEKP